MENGYRTIKITAGMTQEFEIIWTNAPDHVIKAQLMYIAACEEEGKQVPENPYGMIEEFGYVANVIGSQDSLTTEDLEDVIIDAEFDYYDLQEGELINMKKNSYIVVTVSENGKYYAYMIKHNNSNNLLNIANIKGILHANICDTKKEAERIVEQWNESYKQNGTYMFDTPNFQEVD